uniref:CASP-like protein n=1 Tax=Ananas comosus var. bracteatus TaxID=296719 RepID=A0A6V7QKM9_ANACO|nr:unnamed protein product [Ananas comosus var. bracteatus]
MAKALRACVFLLRLFAAAATLVAAVVMATSHETTSYFGFTMEAKFQYTSSFVLLVLLIPSTSSFSRLVIATDVIIGMLLTSAVAATGALSELGKNGNQHAGWLPICGQIHEFCNHVMGALICAFVGLLIYLLILFHTFYVVINPLFP